MSTNKKYYFLKLKETFFNTDEILLLESHTNGILYSNLLLKLYLLSLRYDGELRLNDDVPYTKEMIATITRHTLQTIEEAFPLFEKYGLMVKTKRVPCSI